MSKQDLYRVAADDNPIVAEKVPATPLDFTFPVTRKPNTPFTLRGFLFRLLLIAVLGVVAPISLLFNAFLVGFFAVIFLVGYVQRVYKRIGPIVASRVGSAFLVSHFMCLASFKGHGQLAVIVLIATVGYTAHVALSFREHWRQRAACGQIRSDAIKAFLDSGALPAGIKPKATLPAFAAALRSWITYDPFNSTAPGLAKCPKGEAQHRIAASLTLSILWGGILVTPQALALVRPFGNPFVLLPIAWLLLPFCLPLVAMFLASCSILGKAHAMVEHQFEPSSWSPFIRELHTSKNPIANNSLYLGRVHGDGSPILYPAEQMMRGGWIQGSPGSGKTLFLMQLQEQLIELGYSVVVLDLKASSSELLWAAHAAAERVRTQQNRYVPIYPFTSVHGEASYLLDIYSQKFWAARSPEEKAGIMLGFFGLNYPSIYGQDWFRDAAWLVKQHVTSKYPNIASFHEAAERISAELQYAKEPWELSRQAKEHGEHPRIMLKRVGMVDALNVRPTYSKSIIDSAINLEHLFQKPSVLHCSLPAVTDPIGNPEVGRIILSSLLTTATHTSHRPVKVVVLIDEFQRMVARSLDIVLQQARSRGVGLILTNQSSADLRAVDANMADTIAGNTAFQAWIKATDGIGVEQVRNYGGQYIEHLYSTTVSSTQNGTRTSQTTTEHVLDRVSSGLLDRVNSSNDQFFLRITDDGGYSAYGGQLFVAQSGYHTATKQEYIDRTLRPWPAAVPGMLVNGEHRPQAGPSDSALLGPQQSHSTRSRKRTPTSLKPTT